MKQSLGREDFIAFLMRHDFTRAEAEARSAHIPETIAEWDTDNLPPLPTAEMSDWDRRFEAWRTSPERLAHPIQPDDEFEPWRPAFTDDTVADVKRALGRKAA